MARNGVGSSPSMNLKDTRFVTGAEADGVLERARRALERYGVRNVGTTTLKSITCWSTEETLGYVNIARSFQVRILWKNLHGEAAEAFRTRVTEEITPVLGGWASRTHIGLKGGHGGFLKRSRNKVKAKQTRFQSAVISDARIRRPDRSATEGDGIRRKESEKKGVLPERKIKVMKTCIEIGLKEG
ncbi:hypothetical protein Tco_0629787 [Tanacetum coccineum]|uniref:Uncharacterized protein n=1 Tax=Tanacetum coccineum TaxID=301880 RepID=A0ABQ4WU59_9ASTR